MENKDYKKILYQCKEDLELIISISYVASKSTCIEDFEIKVLFNKLCSLSHHAFDLLDDFY